jgi:predicted RNA-binding Zn ribbon-like protein
MIRVFTHIKTLYIIYSGYTNMDRKTVNRDNSLNDPERLPSILYLPVLHERPCLDFVNTIDWRLSPDRYRDSLSSYADLLAFCLRLDLINSERYAELSEAASRQPNAAFKAFTEARAFRDALIQIIDETAGTPHHSAKPQPAPRALALFDTARRRAHYFETLVWAEGKLVAAALPEKEGLDLPWFMLVRDAEELFSSPLAGRIKVCASEGCGWAFLDTSKNGTRRWCSMKLCGNREKARRFKNKM